MLKVRRNGQQKSATGLATLLQNELCVFTPPPPHPLSKPVNNLICCMPGLMWVVKRATSLFTSFCYSVARQVARFLLPVFPYLKVMLDETIRNDDF